MNITISLKGVEEIRRNLQAKKDRIEQTVQMGVEAGVMMLQTSAQNKVPVKTGNLKRNIQRKVEETGPGKVKGTVYVDLDGAPYGVHIEHGTGRMSAQPFMRPAFDQDGQIAVDKATAIIIEALKE